jgi:hypothetical protein
MVSFGLVVGSWVAISVADRGCQSAARQKKTMRDQLLQFGLVAAFGALCFGCGCLTAFIVTRKQWRGND